MQGDSEFLQWFVGFSDAEAAFMIYTKNNKEVHFVFQITLHIEDVVVLYTIPYPTHSPFSTLSPLGAWWAGEGEGEREIRYRNSIN